MANNKTARSHLLILQVNDVHGYMNLHPEWFWEGGSTTYRLAGGYARLNTLINNYRRLYPDATLLLDGGDTFHGTHPVVQSKGEILLPILNGLGFDAMTAHWDFAYGPKHLVDLVSQLTYPLLAINVFYNESDQLVFPPYRIVERGGLRIGVIGVASNIVDKMMPAHFSEGVYFTLGLEELPSTLESLRQKEAVDLTVLLSHLGIPQTHKLLTKTAGVDVCLCAHTHDRLTQPLQVNGTIMIESGSHGAFLGELLLTLEDKRIVHYEHKLTEVRQDITPDLDMQALIDRQLNPYSEEMDRIVGETLTPLDRSTCLESTMDNLLLAAMTDVTGAEVAFSNGWRYGAPIPAGAITLGQLYDIVPMDPVISTVNLSGREIRQMLEKNLENTFSKDAFKQAGGYVKRTLGLKVFFKMENPSDARIMNVFVNESHIDPNRLYHVAFITMQGVPTSLGADRQDTPFNAVGAMEDYLKHHSPVSISLLDTFVAV
jgi:S-sulfosulfanyl-L-cysteine sulfohydrolase